MLKTEENTICKRIDSIKLHCFWWNEKQNKCEKNISWSPETLTCLNNLESEIGNKIYNKAIDDMTEELQSLLYCDMNITLDRLMEVTNKLKGNKNDKGIR